MSVPGGIDATLRRYSEVNTEYRALDGERKQLREDILNFAFEHGLEVYNSGNYMYSIQWRTRDAIRKDHCPLDVWNAYAETTEYPMLEVRPFAGDAGIVQARGMMGAPVVANVVEYEPEEGEFEQVEANVMDEPVEGTVIATRQPLVANVVEYDPEEGEFEQMVANVLPDPNVMDVIDLTESDDSDLSLSSDSDFVV